MLCNLIVPCNTYNISEDDLRHVETYRAVKSKKKKSKAIPVRGREGL
jgi:hypothetical protein